MLPLLKSISLHMKTHFKDIRDTIGFNNCAVKLFKKELSDQKAAKEEGGLDFARPRAGDLFMF